MEFFKWTEACSVGHPERDREHRSFLESLNTLYKCVGVNDKKGVLQSTLVDLEKYAKEHFDKEEDYLETIGYPGISEQKAQHWYFRSEVEYLKQYQIKAPAIELQSTLQFMRDWFLRHILTSDKKYEEWAKENCKGVA